MTSFKTLCAGLALALAATASSAASFSFSGLTDDSLSFSGSLRFADVASDYTGEVLLTEFSLDFFGQTYALADADSDAKAWFDAGNFLGVDFIDNDDANRASVSLTAGFGTVDEAFFMHGNVNDGFTTFGSVSFVSTPVSEPASLALVLAGIAGAGALTRRRRA